MVFKTIQIIFLVSFLLLLSGCVVSVPKENTTQKNELIWNKTSSSDISDNEYKKALRKHLLVHNHKGLVAWEEQKKKEKERRKKQRREKEIDKETFRTSGLMWQDDEAAKTVGKQWLTNSNYNSGKYYDTSGDTAATYCSKLSLLGYTDWRLPTKSELEDLRKKKNSLKNVSSSSYWSSTTDNYKHNAWYVNFSDSYVNSNYKGYNYYVRCVRAGQ
jgi:hypothetical protein